MNQKYFGRYRIDPGFVEHACCWDSAIVRDCVPEEVMCGGKVALICECSAEESEEICKALNASAGFNGGVT